MSVRGSIASMAFTTNAAAAFRSRCGSSFATPSTVCRAVPSSMTRSFACTGACLRNLVRWTRLPILRALAMCPTLDSSAIFSGRIRIPALRYVIDLSRPPRARENASYRVLSQIASVTQGWGENDRGVSFTFGGDVVRQFLRRHDLDLVVRAHQVVEDGYEFFAGRELVTVFSAPNYCGEFDNAGAMMTVDDTLMCSFQILKPANPAQNRGGFAGGRQGIPGRGGGR